MNSRKQSLDVLVALVRDVPEESLGYFDDMNSRKQSHDVLVALVRDVPEESLGYFVDTIERGFRKFSCSTLLMVTGWTEAMGEGMAQVCQKRLGLANDRLVVVPEVELQARLKEFSDSIIYLVVDNLELPSALHSRSKYLVEPSEVDSTGKVDDVEVIPWPANNGVGDLSKNPPTWTKHFFAESPEMQKQLARVRTVLRHQGQPGMPTNLLITGATGAGKSYFAKCLPQLLLPKYDQASEPFAPGEHSPNECAFVSGNCASLSPELADALLFGAVKGAYTGCDEDKVGLLEGAGEGILFLDEVGELPLQTQSKLLTALEERKFYRLGDTGKNRLPIYLKCFIVFGTNADLVRSVREFKSTRGERGFREDLYFRINALRLHFPSFAERIDGGTATGGVFLNRLLLTACTQYGLQLTEGAQSSFRKFAQKHPWRGNHRELQHIFQSLKIALVMDGMGPVVPTRLMEETLAEASRESASSEAEEGSELYRKIREGQPLNVQQDLDRIFAICPAAANCADAGRRYYGTDDRRNYSDTFAKHLRSLGLAFDAKAPEHLRELN